MPLTCTKCQRTNPAEALFCYFDGSLLPGAAGQNGGPINAGARLFPGEFVFPSGRRCRNFDELSLACVQERPAAVGLLEGGYFESFLSGIGRTDLAMLAKQASRFPDRHRGLDMLIERLPSRVVEPPQIAVEPQAMNLGQLQIGDERRFFLRLTNHGMRLLYGTVAVEKTPWLVLGEDPGVPEKSFDCEDEIEIPVLVRGKKLKADKKPLDGRIVVESNGGNAEVHVRLEVPVKPFTVGILAGVVTQRQLAEQAFKNPKDASPLFENGEVANWYAANGWTYPVQGPTATGIAALQQFLEACGLTQAPKIEIDTKSLQFTGAGGDRLEHAIQIKTAERKPVFAYAISDCDWLVPKPAVLSGTSATLPIEIPSIPYSLDAGDVKAKLTVIANGRQKFVIPVTLHVKSGGVTIGEDVPEAHQRFDEGVELYSDVDEFRPITVRTRQQTNPWLHAMPAAALLLILLGIVLLDFRAPPRARPPDLSGMEVVEKPLDNTPYLDIKFSTQEFHRFGISIDRGNERDKKLTFQPDGRTNNTCVKIDGEDYIFGSDRGRGALSPRILQPKMHWESLWEYPASGVRVTQDVSLRRTDQTEKLQTCLVKYVLKNTSKEPHQIGLRFMLDTYIGNNDGVPFTVPGKEGLCDTMLEFKTAAEIPDFIEALERPDLKNPGTVAHLTLKAGKLEPPSRLLLTAWPSDKLGIPEAVGPGTRWEVPLVSIKQISPYDSAVVMYWEEKELPPNGQREIGFAYGLGKVSTATTTGASSGRLALSGGGSYRPGGVFTVTAYVSKPEIDQRASLQLPEGLKLVEGDAEQRVPPAGGQGYSTVTWKVRADKTGAFDITARSGSLSQTQKVTIKAKSFLD
jgi:hypothetical protein